MALLGGCYVVTALIVGSLATPGHGGIGWEKFEQVLASALRRGDIVIMDRIGSHKVVGVRQAIEGAGERLLYLPPYSPDLNPIEQALAKLKAMLGAKALRTVGALWKALGDLVPCFAPAECDQLSPPLRLFLVILKML